jgi:AraC-like DNA-binding protein
MTDTMPLDPDTIIRLMAVGASTLLLLVLMTGRVRLGLKVPLAGMLVGGALYLILSSTTLAVPRTIIPALDYLSLLTPFWTWLFARSLIERMPPPRLLATFIVFYTVCWAIAHWAGAYWLIGFYGVHIASLLLIADLFYSAWSGRDDDLIEKRRLIRLWLPVLVGLQACGILTFELYMGGFSSDFPILQIANGVQIFALVLFGGLALMQTDPELLVEIENGDLPAPMGKAVVLSPSEQVLRGHLEDAMAAKFYRTPGLTIAALADHLETPEHRLRALINRGLGQRNFSTYLNRHRIAEAKEILADRAQVDLPVLSIAMDLGYNSLPTFNRAFRSETGTTPTEFRRKAIGEATSQN